MKPRVSQLAQSGATTGQVLAWNGTDWAPSSVAASTSFWQDSLTATATATAMTLGASPVTKSLIVWKNGHVLRPGTDYTLSGATVTFASTLATSDQIVTQYSYTGSSSSATLTYASGYHSAVLADSPIVYLTLDDASGTTAVDSSGNAHHGTYVGSPTLGASPLLPTAGGQAVTFARASSQYVTLGDVTALDGITSAWSLECWMKPSATGNSGLALISHGYDGSRVAFALGFGLSDNGSNLQGGFYNGGWHVVDAGAVTASTVYHVVVTWDGTVLTLYKNGNSAATNTPGSGPSNAAQTTYVGRRWDTSGGGIYFDGVLDEVAIYGSALSSTRVAAHYSAA